MLGQSSAEGRLFGDEVVGGACVQECGKDSGAHGHPDLHAVAEGNPRNRIEREVL